MSVPSRSPLIAITQQRSDRDRRRRERLHRRPARQPEHHLRRRATCGYLTRYDHRTGQARTSSVWPEDVLGGGAKDAQVPLPVDVRRSSSRRTTRTPSTLTATTSSARTTKATSWEAISPDLTRNDTSTAGALRRADHQGQHRRRVLLHDLRASPSRRVERGVFWAGTDDGLVHVSRDNGKTWQNVTPPGLPRVDADRRSSRRRRTTRAPPMSRRTRYKHDDFAPYLFKTTDYGADLDADHRRASPTTTSRAWSARTRRSAGSSTPAPRPACYVSFDDGGTLAAGEGQSAGRADPRPGGQGADVTWSWARMAARSGSRRSRAAAPIARRPGRAPGGAGQAKASGALQEQHRVPAQGRRRARTTA